LAIAEEAMVIMFASFIIIIKQTVITNIL